MTNELEMVVPDPRTVDPDQGRELARETFKAMSNSWVWLAGWFECVKRKEYWSQWGFNSFTDYLRSDMSGLAESTVNNMMRGLRYLEATEPGVVEAAMNGGASMSRHRSLPGDNALDRLSSLKLKAEKGVVEQDDYEELHRQAFSGELDNMAVRKKVSELSRGITMRSSHKKDPVGDKLRTLQTRMEVAASEIRSLRAKAAKGEIPTQEGRGIVRCLVKINAAVIHTFGEEQLDGIVAEAKRREQGGKGRPKRSGQKDQPARLKPHRRRGKPRRVGSGTDAEPHSS